VDPFTGIAFELAAIFAGAGLLATLFLFARQPVILAYIAAGILLGPQAFGVIEDAGHIERIAQLGVMLLLFLLGLDLQPLKLLKLFRQTSLLTFGTSLVFFAAALPAGLVLGLPLTEAMVFAAAMMFSSTVIGLKLIPVTTLHQLHAGEVMTSVLLVQDILAILLILFLGGEAGAAPLATFISLVGGLAILVLLAFLCVRWVLIPLFERFDVISEYIFLISLGWCLLCAQAGHSLGLSHEMGAFIGGLALASNRVSLVIAQELKPLREFFLILFFFAVGARFDVKMGMLSLGVGALFGVALVFLKSRSFRWGLGLTGETAKLSMEVGDRLAQASEFSLLVAFAAVGAGVLSPRGESLVQWVTLVTLVLSTYRIVARYPTPIASKDRLRQS